MCSSTQFYTLLAIVLSMFGFLFSHSRNKSSFSFQVFFAIGIMLIFCLLLRITVLFNEKIIDIILRFGLWFLVVSFIQQTIKILGHQPLSETFK